MSRLALGRNSIFQSQVSDDFFKAEIPARLFQRRHCEEIVLRVVQIAFQSLPRIIRLGSAGPFRKCRQSRIQSGRNAYDGAR